MVLVYSVCFMLITAAASILTGVLPGYIAFDSGSVLYLLRKCMEISLLTAFAVLPILAAAAAQKGYILPVCLTLVYTFLGFILLMVNMYLHPLSSMTAIVMRDIPGVVITQPLNIPGAFLCIGVWGVASVLLAGAALKRESEVHLKWSFYFGRSAGNSAVPKFVDCRFCNGHGGVDCLCTGAVHIL